MDTQTGEIWTAEQMKAQEKLLEQVSEKSFAQEMRDRFKPMKEAPTAAQMRRRPPKIKGHERCPCGSGKLFKNCCKS
jgi:hypothetical protein